ncbi:Rieske (2Fe-2S) protein [Nocardioides marmorisolisilvae]|uniref:Cytochrome bc1 complex Rieske iron-sulfur subunit n=1 Tax=Nocardioides marmorisolisilvae TaxID=1542737 RepID=A0A3N0DV80_9ACTN|nr:Rieske (2Fe-2S) protein [Nocardioides marmorisolisilvae]RNL79451.1 Rieske (2Fe-2S) protein [Nocardioides marmorisolisilvae]
MTDTNASRRNVILGVAAVGAAVPVIAACGSSDSSGDKTGVTSSDGGSSAGISTSEIPVGGGKVFAGEEIVVTQPTAGVFKAFSAVCTHQGCLVNKVEDKQIQCPCHFSHYSITDGSVESGPAPKPLPEKTVKVTGDTITVS